MDFDGIAQRYIDTFNETDPARRRDLVRELYADNGRYTDPHVDLGSPAEIEAFIAATQERFPGYRFSLGSEVDGHHDQARFQWHITAPGETDPAAVGFDVLVTGDGRVRRVYGFLDRAPA